MAAAVPTIASYMMRSESRMGGFLYACLPPFLKEKILSQNCHPELSCPQLTQRLSACPYLGARHWAEGCILNLQGGNPVLVARKGMGVMVLEQGCTSCPCVSKVYFTECLGE